MAARSGAGIAGRVRRSGLARAAVAHLGAAYVRLVDATTRWTLEGRQALDEAVGDRSRGFICAVWHGRLFITPTWVIADRECLAMISNNRDGDLIAALVARFGIGTVRGSSHDRAKGRNKGGAGAFRDARVALAERRAAVVMTPDGPRGPLMRAQSGIAQLSIATGCPVLPAAFSSSAGRVMASWDRFLVPRPFGRGAQVFGPLLEPPPPGAIRDPEAVEAHRVAIERAVTAATVRADALCGRAATMPGPRPADALR